MPILRITKKDFAVAVTTNDDMQLTPTGFDNTAYTFDWTGRNGTIPLSAIESAINATSRQRMLRSIWIATDAPTNSFWSVGDMAAILTKRLGSRATGTDLGNALFRFPVCSPYDRISFLIGAKAAEYSIDVMINTTDEGDFAVPELLTEVLSP